MISMNVFQAEPEIPYPVPAHQQKPCKKYKGSHDGLKMSECHAPHYLSIPCHPQMNFEDFEPVNAIINQYR